VEDGPGGREGVCEGWEGGAGHLHGVDILGRKSTRIGIGRGPAHWLEVPARFFSIASPRVQKGERWGACPRSNEGDWTGFILFFS
jgi:hypothetical protein